MPQSRLAVITFLDGSGNYPDNSLPGFTPPVDPGYGQGRPGYRPDNSLPGLPPGAVTLPVFPWDPTIDNSLPSGGRPDNSLPGGGRPDNSLPGGGNIDNSLPGGRPGRPDNSLPGGGVPDQGLPRPGLRYVVKWLACVGLILVPDNSLPNSPNRPDNELPEAPEPK